MDQRVNSDALIALLRWGDEMPNDSATIIPLCVAAGEAMPYDAVADHALNARRAASALGDKFVIYLLDMVLLEIAAREKGGNLIPAKLRQNSELGCLY